MRRWVWLLSVGAAAGLVVAVLVRSSGTGDDVSVTEGSNVSADPVGFARCDDIAMLGSRLEGSLGARQNPDSVVMDVLSAYRKEHPDTYAGTWIDRASGVVVLAFTDDPDGHREAILALVPSPADYPDGDPRSLGEREDVTIDVVHVRYSQAELEAIQVHIMDAVSGRNLDETVSRADLHSP